jgi:hypothetical protein
MTKLIVLLRGFVNAPKKKQLTSKCAKKNIIHGFSLFAGVGVGGLDNESSEKRRMNVVYT